MLSEASSAPGLLAQDISTLCLGLSLANPFLRGRLRSAFVKCGRSYKCRIRPSGEGQGDVEPVYDQAGNEENAVL